MCLYDHQVPLQDVHPEHHVQHVSQAILVNHGFGVSELIDLQEDLLDKLGEGRCCLLTKENTLFLASPDSSARNIASIFMTKIVATKGRLQKKTVKRMVETIRLRQILQ